MISNKKERLFLDLNILRCEREKSLQFKNVIESFELIKNLPQIKDLTVDFDDTIKISSQNVTELQFEYIKQTAISLKPWRKGPFNIFNLFIDTEWQSFIKFNILKPHMNLTDKVVADVGCNNGYYMFKMLPQNPKKIVGFDPSNLYRVQFDFLNHFINSKIVYEMLGIEHLEFYEHKFDVIFCLGVLYHRSDPIGSLKSLSKALNKNGELFLDTFMIDGSDDIALSPKDRYSKIPNIYFIPTINCLKNWLFRAGFCDIEIIDIKKTTLHEQRATEWILGESLNDFLDPHDENRTVEGYDAPKRVYIKAYKS